METAIKGYEVVLGAKVNQDLQLGPWRDKSLLTSVSLCCYESDSIQTTKERRIGARPQAEWLP